MKSTDLATTILGGLGAAVTGAQPVINAMTPGATMHSGDYLQLTMAVIFAVFGWFTNKKPADS